MQPVRREKTNDRMHLSGAAGEREVVEVASEISRARRPGKGRPKRPKWQICPGITDSDMEYPAQSVGLLRQPFQLSPTKLSSPSPTSVTRSKCSRAQWTKRVPRRSPPSGSAQPRPGDGDQPSLAKPVAPARSSVTATLPATSASVARGPVTAPTCPTVALLVPGPTLRNACRLRCRQMAGHLSQPPGQPRRLNPPLPPCTRLRLQKPLQ